MGVCPGEGGGCRGSGGEWVGTLLQVRGVGEAAGVNTLQMQSEPCCWGKGRQGKSDMGQRKSDMRQNDSVRSFKDV